ncbi:hypothetical protein AX17_003855 [Amanita inopinata Kibby_2008]|nr:hypothetical protein AX17_003855 [Amanita inopinata Kibby_2008]
MHSDGFPPACFASNGAAIQQDPVELSESGKIVELLLTYMHNSRQPDLKQLEFDTLKDLVEAVEKYGIYSAMFVCQLFMEKALHDHPLDVFTYATKHHYVELANETAPLTLHWDLDDAQANLATSKLFMAWIKYREFWLKTYQDGLKRLSNGKHRESCSRWHNLYTFVVTNASVSDLTLQINNAAGSSKSCSACMLIMNEWKKTVADMIANIPSFDDVYRSVNSL